MAMTTGLAPMMAPVTPLRGALTPLGLDRVTISSGFWAERQSLTSDAMITHAAGWMRQLGWTANFEDAATGGRYEHRGREFADSEVYKLIEAISWDIARGNDTHGALLEELVATVCTAQEPDGYLHTLFGRPWQRPRYSDFAWGHELYCFGHFLQAAVAHHRATGRRDLLDPARRLADHICTMFGVTGLDRVCGHAEVELGLAELSRATGDDRYLTQAARFIERRGTGTLPAHEFGRAYWQDDIPVRDAVVLRGHAVRALYLAAGAVDVAVDTNDERLLAALVTQWDATVARRTYITGGMGSHHMDEAFGEDFVLPPDRSYCETCAGVASIQFSWRLLLATGQARYADLIERTLFNVIATSPSRDGKAFFYANTLHQREIHTQPSLNDDGVVIRGGSAGRQPWFEVSCCPTNLARTISSLSAYIATEDINGIQLHQFAPGQIDADRMTISVSTRYPDEGDVHIRVERINGPAVLSVRIPEWAEGAVVRVDGSTRLATQPGTYARVPLSAPGQTVVVSLPITARASYPDGRIDACRETVAFERGPEVLALESVDLPDGWALSDVVADGPVVDDGTTVTLRVARRPRTASAWPYSAEPASGLAPAETADITLVPYHDWAERGPSTMRIWIPTARPEGDSSEALTTTPR